MKLTMSHIHGSKHSTFKGRKVDKHVELLKEELVHKDKIITISIWFHVNPILDITGLDLIN